MTCCFDITSAYFLKFAAFVILMATIM